MKKIVVLHVFTDDKFFDGASDFFDSLRNVENLYYFYTSDIKYQFKYIRQTKKIQVFNNYDEYVGFFSDTNIDVIYLQSLSPNFYRFFKNIDTDKKVIWWCFGYEIYSSFGCNKPLVKVDLLQPFTKRYVKKRIQPLLYSIIVYFYFSIRWPTCFLYRKKVINRIDYFSPVLPIEYKLFKDQCSYLKAKPFMIEGGPGLYQKNEFVYKSTFGNVLIGNSLTYTNNHLDVFQALEKCVFQNSQQLIIPVSYGGDYGGNANVLKESISHLRVSFLWLDNLLSSDDYFRLFDSITHSVYGVMRQQAMGNIFSCLAKSVKVFLYQDSLVYKQLLTFGFRVYTIESDLCENALQIPLSEEDSYRNYRLLNQLIKSRKETAEKEFENIYNEST